MENVQKILDKEGLFSTKLEIPYVLNKQEEEHAVRVKIQSLIDLERWKLKSQMISKNAAEERIELMIRRKEFRKMFRIRPLLAQINELKYWELVDQKAKEDKIERERIERERIEKECDYRYMFRVLRANSLRMEGRELICNDDNQHYIKAMCFFLSNDPRFETEMGYSLNKGIMVRGNTGCGKTYVIKCLSYNERSPINMHSMIKINECIRESGEYMINFGKKIYIDDVGAGSDETNGKLNAFINFYGTKINWFRDFIESVNYKQTVFNNLIISTNCSFAEIEQLYGFRVRSRMAQMFNIIDLGGVDLRKEKM
jgi:DNA replication protein DnaC